MLSDWMILYLSVSVSEPFAAVVVEAETFLSALTVADGLLLNLAKGTPVRGVKLPLGLVPGRMKDRLLTGEELAWITALTEGKAS